MTKEEHSWLEALDSALRSDSVREHIRYVVARIREQLARRKDVLMGWEPFPLEALATTLPPKIRSAWVFVLLAGAGICCIHAVVTVEVLCASIAAYLMLGLMWTVAYWLVDQVTPGGAFSFNTNRGTQSMNGFTGFYFSFITLSTVGYGDITPVSRAARWLAAMEAMTGLLYVAVLIARLVSLYSSAKSDDS